MDLKEQFTYHPPQTPERIAKHKAVNEAALRFAEICQSCVDDKIELGAIINQIQVARMLANKQITLEELQGDL